MTHRRITLLVSLVSLISVINLAALPRANAIDVEVLPSPSGANASLSRVIADNDGRLHLSWVTLENGVSALLYSTLENDRWTEPERIAAGNNWFVNWADFPFLVANGDTMVAHWLAKRSEGTYDYDVVATFRDKASGKWSDGRIIHSDGVSAEHGFVSMLPLADDMTLITWLDGRNTPSSHHAGSGDRHEGNSGGMTLRAGVFEPSGATVEEWELDGLVCDCCQTSSAMTNKGPVVAYRNRSPDEIRDIYVTRQVDGEWLAPAAVFNENWKIAGCPVNGPSIAASGENVAVAWFSAKDNQPTVSLSLSNNSGATFAKRVIIASGNTNGRVSTAMLESGEIAVSWLAVEGADATLKLAHYSVDGRLLASTDIAKTRSSRRSGFPVIAATGNEVYITWTDLSDSSRVRIARASF